MSDGPPLSATAPAPAWRLWLRRADVDRTAVVGALSRVWMLASAPVTLLLVARSFTLEVQGYYYTFSSLLALQAFLELGFYTVVVNFASHEWARLGLDKEGRIVGDPDALSRLVSLGRLVFKWYGIGSAIFVFGVGTAGCVLFSSRTDGVNWQGPWLALVVLTGLLLAALPFNTLLEGCNQVETIYRFRLSQAVAGNVALWLVILLGGGLWAAPAWAGVSLARDLLLLLGRYRRFFVPFFRPPQGARIGWWREIWPMQWRLAVSGLVNYFACSLFTPVMFRCHGPEAAGRMGMTLAVVVGLQSVAAVWVQTRAPRFGMLIARRDYAALDRLFVRVALAATGLLAAGALAFWTVLCVFASLGHPLAGRVLPPLPTLLFLLAALLVQVSACQSVYLRAHKQEPFAVLSVVSGLAIGALVVLLGGRYGPTGAAAGYLGVYAVAVVWGAWIWHDCRTRWHGAPAPAPAACRDEVSDPAGGVPGRLAPAAAPPGL